ncbi:GDP-mannose-dependent alpha-(1-6)-phosphatidylinositol monomannoside mannosyltransferase [Geobacteraceae bacterium]|nr:GDP-mannose-dependent alpha-(1-6)-phosphatidylinositol monomannoside mannosyltransferase [Geobacteraceae bacterium]
MTSTKMKLGVVTTHPIQYMAPWFRALAADPALELEVIYFRELNALQQGAGFGRAFQWDVPLRQGYASRVLGAAAGIAAVPRLLLRLRCAVCDIRPDAVLVTGWNEPGLAAAYPLMKWLGVPVILRGDSNALRLRSAMTKLMHRMLLGFVSVAVVVGKANRQFYLDNGVRPDQLFEGAHYVESERMLAMAQAQAQERSGLRRENGFADEDFVFSFVGKHVPFKRPMLLVEAAALARQRGLPVKLLFAGSGELTDALQRRAAELNVPAHFTGFLNQTEMWQAYVPADAFVLPSTNGETWGLVTNEAMLFGLPVIVSDQVGCGPDLVVEGETGYVFSGGAEGLAAAMEKLIENRERAPAMGAAGRRRVLEQYSMPVATAGLKAALKAVAFE